ncbi:hypothetical protein BGX23_008430 [Mortierella sp. AD031]|nr:hypothetical protein BGX23_008430 [Mortierella sp. AD031]
MLCIVKASLHAEHRRFTFCSLDPANIEQETAKLSFEALHSKLCSLFSQPALIIQYVEQSGAKRLIQRDADVVASVVSSSGLVPPTATLMVLKLSVNTSPTSSEPLQNATLSCTKAKQRCVKDKTDICKKDKTDSCRSDTIKKDVCNNGTIKKDTCKKNACKKGPYPSKPRFEDVAVHADVLCDVCMETIKGIRFKCRDCPNYDLCQACHPLAAERYHPNHEFTVIERPLGSSSRPTVTPSPCPRKEAKPIEHAAYCDICTVVIRGVRHKCFQCPDYDLCQECLPLAKVHHRGHSFVPIAFPGEVLVNIDYTPHYGIVCDSCEGDITGIRYKCGNCPDFDLCGNCEASPFFRHDPKHIFLKIRRPVHSRMSPGAPLLPMMYENGWGRAALRNSRGTTTDTAPSFPRVNVDPRPISKRDASGSEHSLSFTLLAPTEPPHLDEVVEVPEVSEVAVIIEVPEVSEVAEVTEVAEVIEISEVAQVVAVVPEVIEVPELPEVPEIPEIPEVDEARTVPSEPTVVLTTTSESDTQGEPEIQPEHEGQDECDTQPALAKTAYFVKDINISDGTTIQAGSQFLKIWEMSNPGPADWPKGTVLQFVGGDRMFADADADEHSPHFNIPLAVVGDSVCVTSDLKAPAHPGRYISYWRLVAPSGEPFGHCIWCDIIVEEGSDSGSDSVGSSTMIFPVVDCQDTKKAWPRDQSNADEATETCSLRTTVTTSISSMHTGLNEATPSVAEDGLSTTSGHITMHSLASSILGRDESVEGRIDNDDNDDISTDRFFSDDDEFIVVDTDGERSELEFRG